MSLILLFIWAVIGIVAIILLFKLLILALIVAVGLIGGLGVFCLLLLNGALEVIIRVFWVGFWFTKIFIPKLRPAYDKFKVWFDNTVGGKNSAFRKY